MRLPNLIQLLVLFLVLGTNSVQAQTKEETKLLKKARKELTQGDYEAAKVMYGNLIKLDSANPLYYFEDGLAYYNSYYQREKALDLFNNALAYSDKDTIAEIFLYLGKTHQYLNNFSEAIKYYNDFKRYTKNNKEGVFILLEVDHLIEMCNNGVALQESTPNDNITAENIGSNINSRYAEYGQVVNSKSDVLLFTARDRENLGDKLYSDYKKYEDIYISFKKDGKWSPRTSVDSAGHFFSTKINTKKHDAVIGFSDNDEKLYIYQNNGILVSSRESDGRYGKPQELKAINSSGREPSAFITKNGKLIFFSSSRKGGKGGLDLYYSMLQGDGNWSEPVNMTKLNTPLNEDAPYLSDDGKVLYFASQGHNSIGGYDIFKSTLDENGHWSAPVNIGLNYNSGGDDIFYIRDTVEHVGYFSSSRANGYGDVDIYKFYPTPAMKNMQLFAGIGKPAYKIKNKSLYLDKETGDIYVMNHDNWELSKRRIASGSGVPADGNVIPANIYINSDNANVFAKEEGKWTDYGGGIDYGSGMPTKKGKSGDIYVDKESGKAYVFEYGAWRVKKGNVTIGRGIPEKVAKKGAVYVNVRTGDTYVSDGKRWFNRKGGLEEGVGEPTIDGRSGDLYLNTLNADMFVHDGTQWKNIDKGMLESKGRPKEIASRGTVYYDKKSDIIYISDGEKWIKHGDPIPDFDCDELASTEIRGIAYQGDYNTPVLVTITAYDLNTGEEMGQWTSDETTGKYLMVLPPNNSYRLEISNPEWKLKRPFRDTIHIPKQCEVYQLFQRVHFNDVKKGGDVVAQEAVFDNAMFDIKKEAMQEFKLDDIDEAIVQEEEVTEVERKVDGKLLHNDLVTTKEVEVSLINSKGEIVESTKTGKLGDFTFNNVKEGESYSLLVNENDVKMSYYGNQPNNAENSVIVKGFITLKEIKDGKEVKSTPIADAEVIFITDDKKVISKSKANEKGAFVLDNVTEVVDDRVFVYKINVKNEDELYESYLSTLDTADHEFYTIIRDLLQLEAEEEAPADVVVVEETVEKTVEDYPTDALTDNTTVDEVEVQKVDFKLNPIYFDFDKFFLRFASKEFLDKLYDYMKDKPDFVLEISGHTDWIGTDEYNMALSKKRALSAFKYLAKKGISEDNLVIKWYGESRPAVPNANPDGTDNPDNRQLNRRCEFKFQSNETAYVITIM